MNAFNLKLLLYISRLRFSKLPDYYFPFYMLIRYIQIRKLQQRFKIIAVPYELINKYIENYGLSFCDDTSNCIVVDESHKLPTFVKITKNRLAYVISAKINKNITLISDQLQHNLGAEHETTLKPFAFNKIPTATFLNLSVINTYHDLDNSLIDTIVKNYFKTPKFVQKNDLILIDLKKYAPEFYYTNNYTFELKTITFKCNELLFKPKTASLCGFCIIGDTEIKQSPNVQDFLAPTFKNVPNFSLQDYEDCLIDRCPYGLEGYAADLANAVAPFLKTHKLHLKPSYLLEGSKGSGKTLIVSSVASKLGLHLFETTSSSITASVYAQTEIKIRNIFFKAKLCAPCVLLINNFENFGKNNEGEYDERIIDFFKCELENLFTNNTFPVILIGVSNSKNVHPELYRTFLEVFHIPVPDETGRLAMLNWILASQNLSNEANLEEIARKTHGFLFEDLKALVFYARKNSMKNIHSALIQDDFQGAFDLMQVSYNQSLGAPEIPKVLWSDVGGLSEVKREIINTIDFPLRHPDFLRTIGLKRSGILLYGPPGTGKTLIAKAVATECGLCFLSVKGPELLNMYVGQSEQNVRDVFQKARDASPCIIFFDELDSLAPNRGIAGDSGGVMDRVVSQLLAEMDGLEQTATTFIIGATNRPDLIDPALLRPGRFDKLLYIGPCNDVESKIGVLEALTRKFKLSEDANLREIVKLCPKNITGADLYGLCSNAWMAAVRKMIDKFQSVTYEDVIVCLNDFKVAMKELKPSINAEDLIYFDNLQKQLNVVESKLKKK